MENFAQDGLAFFPGYLSRTEQEQLVDVLREAVTAAPLFTPVMPGTGKAFSVRMTNLGTLGWVSDHSGYRYQKTHPETGRPWPTLPSDILSIWEKVSGCAREPEACLVNFYSDSSKMGMHQDRDEDDFTAPIVSVSLGDKALFRIGGVERGGKTQSFKLTSGDVLVMGGPSRLRYHGIDRIYPGSSTLLRSGGRINLTLRRVSAPFATEIAACGQSKA